MLRPLAVGALLFRDLEYDATVCKKIKSDEADLRAGLLYEQNLLGEIKQETATGPFAASGSTATRRKECGSSNRRTMKCNRSPRGATTATRRLWRPYVGIWIEMTSPRKR